MALGRANVSRLLRTCVQFWASGQGASMSSAIQSARMEFNSSGVMPDPGLCSGFTNGYAALLSRPARGGVRVLRVGCCVVHSAAA